MAVDLHRLAEVRSLELHREAAERVRARPELVAEARVRLARWAAERVMSGPYVRAWEALLDGPIETLLATLVEESERARDLRQCSPLSVVVDSKARWRITREVRERLGR